MTDPAPIIAVVDDDPSVREALDGLLRSVGMETLLFGSVKDFLAAALPDRPTCLVLDVRLPGQSGLDLQAELARKRTAPPIIFITGHGDIPMSVRAMKAGAVEFLAKPFRDQDLLDAIHVALDRDRERRREAEILSDLNRRLDTLTVRERQVFQRVVKGLLNKQIAGELNVTEVTVKVHRGQVMRKMGAATLVELVRIADRLGLAAASPGSA